MTRFLLSLAAVAIVFTVHSQSGTAGFSVYEGKYEANGFVIQILIKEKDLTLAVPGAPLQSLLPVAKHRFRSIAFENEYFVFVEENGKITRLISEGPNGTAEFGKTSDRPDRFDGDDILLTHKKETANLTLLFSDADSLNVRYIASILENNRDRIVHDFRLKRMGTTTIRIYPTMESFHRGINFPNAPPNILATAFGKDDFRMVSPSVTAADSVELVRHVLHEFTHCVHLHVSYSPNNPRWLWEGVAMYECGWFADPKHIDVIRNKQDPPFAALNNGLEYELGYVIVEAIRELWGFDKVVELIKKRGDTQAVLKLSQEDFEKKIYDAIRARYQM